MEESPKKYKEGGKRVNDHEKHRWFYETEKKDTF